MSITLDPEQQLAIDHIYGGKNVFLTGGGGTGKSKVLEIAIQGLKNKYSPEWKDKLGITSTTGSSALLIGGTTIHSFSGIGVSRNTEEKIIAKIARKKHLAKRWRNIQTLIIDEISMLTPITFRLLYLTAQRLRKNNMPFGGIQIVLSGDFCQLAPILEQHIPVHHMEYCFETPEWEASNINVVQFKTIHRQSDTAFIQTLQKIRMGLSDQDTTSLLMEQYRKELDNTHGILPVQLFPTRERANDVNRTHFSKLNVKDSVSFGIVVEYSRVIDPEFSVHKDEYERKIISQLPIDDKITLKVGCQVILVVNLSVEEGFVNGSKGVVTDFNEKSEPIVTFSNGITRTIQIHTWEIEDSKALVKVKGLPLIMGYACTIHRSQGMSIDLAKIDIGRNVFSGSGGYGQVYVALSRVRSLRGLSILNFDPSKIRCHPKVIEYYRMLDSNIITHPQIKSDDTSISTDSKGKKVVKRKVSPNGDIRQYFTTFK